MYLLVNLPLDSKYGKFGKELTFNEYIEEYIAQNPQYIKMNTSQQNQHNQVISSLKRKIELSSSQDANTYIELGDVLAQKGILDEASKAYRQAIAIQPKAYFYYKLGLVLNQQGDLDAAIVAYLQAVEIYPQYENCYRNLAQIIVQNGSFLYRNLDTYRSTIKNNSNFALQYNNIGDALKKQGNIEEAIYCYRKAVNFSPETSKFYINLIQGLAQEQQWSDALVCYLRAIQVETSIAFNLDRIAYPLRYVKITQEQLEEVIQLGREVIQNQPELPKAYIFLGDMLSRKGKIKEAISCYRIALDKMNVKYYPALPKSYRKEQSGKPDFIIIGTSKSGTTSLYRYATQHPQVLSALKKEVDFFTREFEKGVDWYRAHFSSIPEDSQLITGEASPGYFPRCYDAPQRIISFFPNVKLLVIFRNPVDRTISHYYHNVKNNIEHRSLAQVIEEEVSIIEEMRSGALALRKHFPRQWGYIFTSLYVDFLKQWMKIFPREQFFILKAEELYDAPEETMNKVFDFIEVPAYQLSEYKNFLPGAYDYREETEPIRQKLRKIFQHYNQELESYIGIKFDW